MDLLVTSIRAIAGEQNLPRLSVVALQEVARGEHGWASRKDGKWCTVSYQGDVAWRGTGISYKTDEWAVMRRRATLKGTWFRLRHLQTQSECWIGSLYIAPHFSAVELQGLISQHLASLPATTLPVLLGADTNAGLKWHQGGEGSPQGFGSDGKGKVLHDTLPSFGYQVVPPREQQLYQPTSRPRQESFVGRAIDWVAAKHVSTSRALICTDSCFHLGTDHDLIAVHLDLLQRQNAPRRVRTGRRRVTTPVRVPSEINQTVLEDLARAHTSPPASNSYVDDATTKRLFAVAKRSKLPGDWKKALKARKTAHDKWRRERVQKAIAGDWVALKECQQPKGVGWEGKFAEHVAPRDPHDLLHDHFANALSNPSFASHRSSTPPCSTDITEAELDAAIQAGKPGRSVGIDGVCFELLRDLSQDSQGKKALLAWYNSILHSGRLPERWKDVVLILLPKKDSPQEPKHVRGIAMGSSAEKLFTRIVLNRAKPHLPFLRAWQCCAPHRQSSDLIFCLHRLAEVDREWGRGICILKLDFRAAFDNVDRDKLLGNLFTRMGDSEEFRIFECLLTQSYCNLQSPWSTTRFPSQKGIRQGAIESPYLFGLLIEWVIEEVSRRHSWEESICTYKDLHVAQIAFMDDVYLWEGRADILERKANQLRQGFLEWGLHINAEKSALYLSPKHVGKNTISLGGVHLVPQTHIDVMGMPLAVGAKVTDLLQPTWARAKGRFWSLRHLLLADAPIGERIKLLHKTCRPVRFHFLFAAYESVRCTKKKT